MVAHVFRHGGGDDCLHRVFDLHSVFDFIIQWIWSVFGSPTSKEVGHITKEVGHFTEEVGHLTEDVGHLIAPAPFSQTYIPGMIDIHECCRTTRCL